MRYPTRGRAAAIGLVLMATAIATAAPVPLADVPDAHAGQQERPNVVVVMTDDQTLESMRVMETVNSRIGARGVTFANAVTNFPLCCPSRATFLTGQYAHNHNVRGNTASENGGFTGFDDSSTLATWLHDAGYATTHVGKYLNEYGYRETDPPTYIPPGWDEWWTATGRTTQSAYNYVLNENGTLVEYGNAPEDFQQDVFTAKAVDSIERNVPSDQPFFLSVDYSAPHDIGTIPDPTPPTDCGTGPFGTSPPKPAPRHAHAFDSESLPTPPNFNEADVSDKPAAIQAHAPLTDAEIANLESYYRCELESLLSVDEGVGHILDALESAGELDNTYVIYWSDNGFFHGEHRVRSAKNRVYEEAIHIPMLIRGPGIPAGQTVREPVINADLAPTIVDVTGAEPGLVMDGRSLLFSLAGDPGRTRGRDLLIERLNRSNSPQDVSFTAVRSSRFVYVENDNGDIELYDLRSDPFQLESQHANPTYAGVRQQLAARLAALRDCAGKSCRTMRHHPRLDLANVAEGKSATQSSTFVYPAGRAVDGNTDGNLSNGSTTHTALDQNAWWQVDLGQHHPMIREIDIWNRADCCAERLSDYYVLVSDEPFTSTSLDETLNQPGVWASHQTQIASRPTTVPVGRSGRYLRIQLTGTNYLSISEVQAWAVGAETTNQDKGTE